MDEQSRDQDNQEPMPPLTIELSDEASRMVRHLLEQGVYDTEKQAVEACVRRGYGELEQLEIVTDFSVRSSKELPVISPEQEKMAELGRRFSDRIRREGLDVKLSSPL